MNKKSNQTSEKRDSEAFDQTMDTFKNMVFEGLFSQEKNIKDVALSVLGPSAKEAQIIPLITTSTSCNGILINELSFIAREKGKKDELIVVSFQSEMNAAIEKKLKEFCQESLKMYQSLKQDDADNTVDKEVSCVVPYVVD